VLTEIPCMRSSQRARSTWERSKTNSSGPTTPAESLTYQAGYLRKRATVLRIVPSVRRLAAINVRSSSLTSIVGVDGLIPR